MTPAPTVSGWVMSGAAAVCVVVGIAFDYPEMTAIGLSAATLVFAAVGWVVASGSVTAKREVYPLRVTEGAPVTCELTVSNRSRMSTSELEVTEIVAKERKRYLVDTLAGRAAAQVCEYPLTTARRGVYRLPPPAVEIVDPARLVRRRFTTSGATVFYVHPRYDDIPAFEAGDRRDADGLAFRPSVGGIAFYSLRDYLAGDDPRLIHWPSTARTGTLKVRQNGLPDTPGYLIVLHTSAVYREESFEDAVRVVASLTVAAKRTGARLYVRTTNRRQTPSHSGGVSMGSALDFLAEVTPDEHLPEWAAALAPDDDVAGVTVVTGAITEAEVALIARSCDSVTSLRVVRIDQRSRAGRVLSPVDVLTVTSSFEFVAHWDRR